MAAAVTVALPDGVSVAVASLPSQSLLKLFAWRDRGNQNARDAIDLRYILLAYSEGRYLDALYTAHEDLVERNDFDPRLAGAERLGARSGDDHRNNRPSGSANRPAPRGEAGPPRGGHEPGSGRKHRTPCGLHERPHHLRLTTPDLVTRTRQSRPDRAPERSCGRGPGRASPLGRARCAREQRSHAQRTRANKEPLSPQPLEQHQVGQGEDEQHDADDAVGGEEGPVDPGQVVRA